MRRRWTSGLAALCAITAAGLAIAQPAANTNAPAANPAMSPPAAPRPLGYLTPESTPDAHAILPPPPQPGTQRYERDRRVFRETRALSGSPRWTLAQTDNGAGIDAMMTHFSCALGVLLTPANAPRLAMMMRRVSMDHSRITNAAKNLFRRQRPFLVDDGEICIPNNTSTDTSYDYPTGHGGWGWEWGLVLAELAPDRATPLLVRARAFGESRVVCGVHNASSPEASRTTASVLVAALHAVPDFRTALEAARSEVAAARAAGPAPDPQVCTAEQALTASTPWTD